MATSYGSSVPDPLEGEWHYLPFGAMTHHRRLHDGGLDTEAACEIQPLDGNPDAWRGGGSQAEHDTARALPRCRVCEARVGGA